MRRGYPPNYLTPHRGVFGLKLAKDKDKDKDKDKAEQLYFASFPSALPDIRKGIRVKAS